MEDPPYISVYVPSSPSSSLLDQKSQDQSSPSIKFTTISIRRGWNRLSRLQKSVVLMTLSVFLGFTFVLALTWTSHPSSEATHNGYQRLVHRGFDNNNNNNIVRNQGVGPPTDGDGQKRFPYQPTQSSAKRINKQDWKLPKKSSAVLPTVPRALKPDYRDSSTDNGEIGIRKPASSPSKGINKQLAENIRSIISLDPVVPLDAQKSVIDINKPVDGLGLKFNGPQNPRQAAVVEAFLHAWNGYKKYAWGQDHLRPISGGGQDWFGLGLTIIDSLDTMYIMNLEKEFSEARRWVEKSLSFDVSKNVNLFETTIRVLGGLLSAYHMSGDEIFLTKSQELGSALLVGFKSPSGIPYSDINLRSKTAHGPTWNPDSTTSEVSTIQLEFRDLSRITSIPIYEESAMNVSRHIHNLHKNEGLVPIHITPSTGHFRSTSVITLGARGDSYYEYLLKQWIQTGKKIDFLRDDYLLAVEGINHQLLQRTKISNLTFIGELDNGRIFRPKMDHLVCYLPGTLALGVSHGLPEWHLDLAKSLLYTCYLTYKQQPTGLAPEITFFKTENEAETDFFVKPNDAHNLLRPETIESLWYLNQITGDKKYQDWGWEIFQSFLKYTRVQHGFTSIGSVLNPENTRPRDMMESFFLGETLKYFYLLFSDKPIFDLNTWVFNTEAHPFPIRDH